MSGNEAASNLTESRSPARARVGLDLRLDWPVALVGTATLLNGLLGLLKGLLVRFRDNPRLFDIPLPYGLYHLSRILTLVFGFLLFYLAFHLFQRRRVAWLIACVSLAAAAIPHLGHGHHFYLAAVPLATLGLLLAYRRRFTVRSEPRNIAQGLALMGVSLFLALAFGVLGFWLLDKREFGMEFQWGDSFVRALRQYLLIGNSDLVPHTAHARWFLDALSTVGITSAAFAVYSLFRPLAFRFQVLPHERTQAEQLLERYGSSPEQYFTLERDKSYYFNPDASGFIAYRAAAGVALGLADPVAPAPAVPGLIRDFLSYSGNNGWKVALLYVGTDFLAVYEQARMRSLKIGADAIVNLEHFCQDTRNSKQFRKVKRRLEEDGMRMERFAPPHNRALIDQVEEVSRAWLSLPGRRERSFAQGVFSRDYVGRTPLFTVLDRNRQVIAFANQVPAFRPGTATIDLMRHRADSPHGTMDYLLQEALCWLQGAGFRQFDLGLAPLAGVGVGADAVVEERIVRQVYELVFRSLAFEGLYTYKAKFEPAWEDRYLVYTGGPAGLARIGLAMSRILR